MKKNMNITDIAVIFKLKVTNKGLEYTPVKVAVGIYDNQNKEFIDNTGTPYYHIIDGNETYGFAQRIEITNLYKKYPFIALPLIKTLIINAAKKFNYIVTHEEKTNAPIICINDKKGNNEIFIDEDSIIFYLENYPELGELLKNKNIFLDMKTEEKEKTSNVKENKVLSTKLNINELYNEITNNVIDQDEPIKKILTAIWKQYNNFSDTKSRNILINGSTGVGKTEIFRNITRLIDIPCVITSATQYTAAGYVGKNVEDMLISLLEKADGDLERAQRGIIIIDELDKLSESNNSSQVNQRDVQEALLKIIEDGKFDINYYNKNITFDTSKVMVVGMGSWSRIKLEEKRHVGFNSTTEKKEYKDLTTEDFINNGMIPELIGRFPIIVQMNELNADSFIKILNNSKNNALNINKQFFKEQGITLTINDETINLIANKALKNNFGARSLDEIIERALSVATFEIASNPEVYSKLIITPETIEDNRKYTLVKKLENK